MQPSEEVKQRINIVDLVGETVQLRKAGANFRARCPFHDEKTPSFMVSPAKQIWHCFGCGLGGDIFEFVKQSEGVEFPEALQILASRAGIILKRPTTEYRAETDKKKTLYEINDLAAKYYQKVLSDSKGAEIARSYLNRRGFKPATIAKWQIGYAPDDFHFFENFVTTRGYQKTEAAAAGLLVRKDDGSFYDRFRGRIMFPLFDLHGRVVGFTARLLADAEGAAKYINSPETLIYQKSRLVYGLHLAKTGIRKADFVIVVEGNADVITCHEAGSENVVGSSGTALTQEQLELLKRFTENISFAFDVDEAGLAAGRRAVELALSMGFNVRVVSIPRELAKDPDELIRKDFSLWQERVAAARPFLDFYFHQIFANIDLSESSGKKQAVSQILPLLSLLPDPIDRTHYVRLLAEKLGVDEQLVLDLLNRAAVAKGRVAEKSAGTRRLVRKSYEEILEDRALGFLLKFSPDLPGEWEKFGVQDFGSLVNREIFAAVVAQRPQGLEDFFVANPRFRDAAQLLVFAVENELSALPEWNLEDAKPQFLGGFRHHLLKKKMRTLTTLIRQAETTGRMDEAKVLTVEFNNLSRDLAKYHAQ